MTECIRRGRSEVKFKERVEIGFDGGRTTSDGGVVLLSEVDRDEGLTELMAGCVRDSRDSRYVRHAYLVRQYLDSRSEAPKEMVLDVDATDDPAHGKQEQIHFHGYYGCYVYLPLLVYDGESGELLEVVLRRGNAHASRGAVGLLRRIVRQIRERWPKVEMTIRGDAGFAVPRMYEFCESEGLRFIIALISNERLKGLSEDALRGAVCEFEETGEKGRRVTEGRYQAESWPHARRVIMKAEAMPQGTNQRFLVTNLSGSAQELYRFYACRGEVENRIKDLKNALNADRLSCHEFLANQFRLLLHGFAYVLMHRLRRLLSGTELARVQFDTLRLKLLKVGGRVKQSVRRIRFWLSESYPYKAYWKLLALRLGRPLLLRC